ncbi:sialate:O-sulfotransferase 2-like [Cloeon dipterum]|uniref:sialate:O-sulfotransferase 2-like n=1 Tax=Cloeon dipterum TaxID=197152 RepID=UPI00322075A9
MSPFLKMMQLFLMMTATVLGMLMLLLVTPDIEDSMLRAVRRYNRRIHTDPVVQPVRESAEAVVDKVDGMPVEPAEATAVLKDQEMLRKAQSGLKLDVHRRTFIPWPNSVECGHYGVHFVEKKSLPMAALVSFPGSGNTWVRYLMETSSGVFTGSVYTDRQILTRGFYGEVMPPDCGCTSVQKTHGFALAGMVPPTAEQKRAELTLFKGRGVLLLRNPYEAIISYRNYLYGGHTGFAPYDSFRGPEWEQFAIRLTEIWRELAATWIVYSRDAMVLHYELMKNEPITHLKGILHFLKFPVDNQRLMCVVSHIDGPFRRPSTQQLMFEIKDPYPDKVHHVLDAAIDQVNALLRQKGWQQMPTHLYKFYRRVGGGSNVTTAPNSPNEPPPAL